MNNIMDTLTITKKITVIVGDDRLTSFDPVIEDIKKRNNNPSIITISDMIKINKNNKDVSDIIDSYDNDVIVECPETSSNPKRHIDIIRDILKYVNINDKKIVVLTYSDYLVRELTALVALGSMKVPLSEKKKATSKYSVFDDMDTVNCPIHHKDIQVLVSYIPYNETTISYFECGVNNNGTNVFAFNDARESQEKLFSVTNNFLYYDRNVDKKKEK